MKLFLLNKDEFDKDFQSEATQKAIHKTAYNHLLTSIGMIEEIPDVIEFYYDGEYIRFDFKRAKAGIYFYLYIR